MAEYLVALAKTLRLMIGLARSPGFDVIQACNPPDLFFPITWPFKLAGKRFIFDQHDLSPELYSTLYGRDSGPIMWVLRWSERLSYRLADAVIASNESYRRVALTRGRVAADRVFVVRNGPREGWPRAVGPTRPSRAAARCSSSTWGSWATRTGSTCCWTSSTPWSTAEGSATRRSPSSATATRTGTCCGRRGSWASRSSSTSPAGSRTRTSCHATS